MKASFIFSNLLALGAVHAAIIPTGAKDGIYTFHEDPLTGKKEPIWMGPVNTTTTGIKRRGAAPVRRQQSVTCDESVQLNPFAFSFAEAAMENAFANGISFRSAISFVNDGAIAFACSSSNSVVFISVSA